MPFDPNSLNHASLEPRLASDPIRHDSSDTVLSTASRPSDTRQARLVQPQVLKHPSLLANIRKTWTGPNETASQQSGGNTHRSRRGDDGRDGKFASSGEGVAGDDDENYRNRYLGDAVHGETCHDEELGRPQVGDRVVCAKWDSLPGRPGGEPRRILLLAYDSGAFAIWDCSSLDSWFELVSLRSLESALEPKLAKRYPRGIGFVVDYIVLPSNSIALVTRRANSSSSHVLLYTLDSHVVASAFDVPGVVHRISANRRYVTVSTSTPLALHVLSVTSLEPIPFSPISDLVPSPFDGAPVFSLGSGGRLLAYATDRSIPSSRLDRSPAKPGAGLLAQSGLFDTEPTTPSQSTSDFFTRGVGSQGGLLMSEAGQVGEQVARKVSEGVMSGVKAIGEVGMSYWLTRSTNGRNQDGSVATGRDPKLSKSAPAQTVAGFGRRRSVPSSTATPPDSLYSAVAGTVIVVDLASTPAVPRSGRPHRPSSPSPSLRTIAHFRPYHLPLALISFSPSSTSLLTSSTSAHSFDIFELHPSCPIGTSALRCVPSSSDANSGKVWHRYRLQRGYTTARATSATWSDDGRFVAVGTGKGTAHTYAIQPMGGNPNLEKHFEPQVQNLTELPPLSINLSTIARVRPSSSAAEDISSSSRSFPSFAFVPRTDSFASSFRPASKSFTTDPSHPRPGRSSSPRMVPIQDLLVFDPSSTTAQLHRLSLSELATSSSSAVAAASRGDVGKLATNAVSGLTQLMKSRGGFGGAGQAGGSVATSGGEQKKEWVVKCAPKAEWSLLRNREDGDITEDVSIETCDASPKRVAGIRYSAFAEIETFSRSPRVLPRSVYESQQFTFFSLPSDYSASTARGLFHFSRARSLEMRSQVLVRQGEHTISSDTPLDIPFEPASFDQPIRTAMQTVLDQEAILAPGSPKLPAPSFPVGIAAKQGSWRDSMPIRSVGPAAIEGFGRVRQGLGRVRLPNAGELVDAARRRRSSVATLLGSSGPGAYSSSISFDGEEAVFADKLLAEEMGSASTACTSEGDEADRSKGLLRDEVDEWGWDEPIDEPSHDPRIAPSPIDDALSQPLFDDDFDNFELELSAPPPPTIKAISPPPSIAVELPSVTPSSPVRILAPPVAVPASKDDSPSPPPAPSPSPFNPLLEVHVSSSSTPLSSSPASIGSASSSGGGGGKKKKRK
ncbi:hypothetical protein JCM16303_002159 [Sporobolomyces ruberrimus]